MTHASDESTLGRGSDLSHRYRQLPVDSVPADLDQLIIDHARAAVAVSDSRRSWIRWGFPLGLVGTAVLAATLVLDSTREPRSLPVTQLSDLEAPQQTAASPGVEPGSVATDLSSSPAASGSALLAPAAAAEPRPVMTARPLQGATRRADSASNAAAAIREPQAAPLVADVAAEPAFAASSPASAVPLDAGTASAAPMELPALPASATTVEVAAPPEAEAQSAFEGLDALKSSSMSAAKQAAAEERLEDIRYMRQTGRNRGADKAWRNFLEDFPNYPVAADDIARPRER